MFKKLLPLVAEDREQNAEKAHSDRMDRLHKHSTEDAPDDACSESDGSDDLVMDDKLFM